MIRYNAGKMIIKPEKKDFLLKLLIREFEMFVAKFLQIVLKFVPTMYDDQDFVRCSGYFKNPANQIVHY